MKMMMKFDLDDVLIVPAKKTHIKSRYNDIHLPSKLPIFTAPMDTVVNLNNIDVFINNGISVVLPRTIKYNDFKIRYIDVEYARYYNIFISLGFEDIDHYLKNNMMGLHNNAHILLDVANGHMQRIVDYCKEIKRLRPDIVIMVGNIANPETYEWYTKEDCVDYIRLSIGSGAACTTSKNGGIGYPLGSLISEINEIRNSLKKIYSNMVFPKIIADGGMKEYSDIIKAFALGCDYVMLGSIFNKAFESCADNYIWKIKIKNNKIAKLLYDYNFPLKKHYRGMSTKAVQKALGRTTLKTSEGVYRFRKVEYYLSGWIENFNHYLRSAMSYTNCKTLECFIGNVKYIIISNNSYKRFDK